MAAEFALVKAKRFRMETLANQGSRAASLSLRIQSNMESYLAACQLGITMASLGLGWVGEPAVAALLEPAFTYMGMPAEILHTSAFIVGFLIFSSLHIVVGEQVPKTLAIRKAEPVSLWVTYPLHWAYLTVYPLNWLLNATSGQILKLFNVAEATHGDVYSNDELKGLVATSEEHGHLGADKAEMLKNLFEFDERQISRVMIPRTALQMLDLNASVDDNLAILRDSGHSRFPLIDSRDEETIIGIILAKDLYATLLKDGVIPWDNLTLFARDALLVPDSQKVARLFETMRSERAHMALVVDEYGVLTGVVTLEDLLEEIVGEIEDETDSTKEQYAITQLSEHEWLANGLASLSDIERQTGLKVPDDLDANTLSGLCMAELGQLPAAGDQITIYGYSITIKSVENNRVGQLSLTRLSEAELDTINNEDT